MQLSSLLVALLPLLQPVVSVDEATVLRATTFLNPPSVISGIVEPSSNKSQFRSNDLSYTGTCDLKLFDTQPASDYQPCNPPTFQIKYAQWGGKTKFSFEIAHAVNYPSNGVYVRKSTQTVDSPGNVPLSLTASTVPASLQTAPAGWVGDIISSSSSTTASAAFATTTLTTVTAARL